MTAQYEADGVVHAQRRAETVGARLSTPLFVVPDMLSTKPTERSRMFRRGPQARRYLRGYLTWLRVSDLIVVVLALAITTLTRFGLADAALAGADVGYRMVGLVLAILWMLMLHLHSAYDGRFTGHGVQEYRQVFRASMWLFSGLAIAAYVLKVDVARGYVMLAFPLGTLLLLMSRYAARRWLVRERRAGRQSDGVLLVGNYEAVEQLAVALRRTPDAGYNVLGACVDDARVGSQVSGIPVVGAESDVLQRGLDLGVDVIAVSSSSGLGSKGLRHLGWALEGTDVDLVVAPGIMDVAGPRVQTRPVQGLPLIHVEAPTFSGPSLVLKSVMDRVGAGLLLLVLSPVFLGVALAIKREDGGPVFYRQERVGRDGRTFSMFKFRSMRPGADKLMPQLQAANEASGPRFKLRNDPRITRVGVGLRRHSLDELPQLINVLLGSMSLVGPRPPLPREVLDYGDDDRRRLLVKPGMTGLWQINGRSDLSWEESVRLDLYYVENWTPVLDLMILWRTVRVVARGEGAY